MEKRGTEIVALTADVRVLTVGGKQVTLSVFRQLEESCYLIDYLTGSLKAEPWGYVNYHDKSCRGAHVHVVFSNNGCLYKNTVYPPALARRGDMLWGLLGLENSIEEYSKEAVYFAALAGWKPKELPSGSGLYNDKKIVMQSTTGEVVDTWYSTTFGKLWGIGFYADKEEMRKQAEEEMRNFIGERTFGEIMADLRDARMRHSSYLQTYQASYSACLAAGQLFIAV